MSRNPARRLDIATLENYLGYQLRQAQAAAFRDLAGPFRELKLTPGEFSLLTIVDANPGVRQTDLLKLYGLDKSTMSVAVKRLVGRGLVVRQKLQTDRRYHGLTLTPAGESSLCAAAAIVAAQEDRMAAAIGTRDRERLMRLLPRIVGALTAD